MYVPEARRLRALEDGKVRLKWMQADAMIDNVALNDLLGKKMVTPAVSREAVAHLQTVHDMSEWLACRVLICCRMSVHCQYVRSDDASLLESMRAASHERWRFGHWRIHVLLKREGFEVNHKHLVQALSRRKTVRQTAQRAQTGHRRALTDDCTRECLILTVDRSLSGLRVARKLDRIMARRGKPKMIVSDNGTEFTSNAIFNGPTGFKCSGIISHQ